MLFRSEMNSSPLAPPVAKRFECLGLNWRALIAPLCFWVREIKASLQIVNFAAQGLLLLPLELTWLLQAAYRRSIDPTSHFPDHQQ